MFPKTYTDKTSCLESLVGIRSQCVVDTEFPFWIEDVEGVDIKRLSNLAGASDLNGKDVGKRLINSAAREMMGDIELLLNNGNRLQEIAGQMCSTCSFVPTYVADGGIKVKSVIISQYQRLRISQLKVLADFTGETDIVIDDGITPKTFTVDLTAGTIITVKLSYLTDQREVTIKFDDSDIGGGKIVCSKNTSCGCSGSAVDKSPILLSGIVGEVDSSTQYGFLPCATVECSNDALVCSMIASVPNIFGLALMFKVGEKYFASKFHSERNNSTVSFGENNEEQVEQGRNYGRLYWAKMQGGKDRRGIKNVIHDFLTKKRADKCVICDSKISVGYVTG